MNHFTKHFSRFLFGQIFVPFSYFKTLSLGFNSQRNEKYFRFVIVSRLLSNFNLIIALKNEQGKSHRRGRRPEMKLNYQEVRGNVLNIRLRMHNHCSLEAGGEKSELRE